MSIKELREYVKANTDVYTGDVILKKAALLKLIDEIELSRAEAEQFKIEKETLHSKMIPKLFSSLPLGQACLLWYLPTKEWTSGKAENEAGKQLLASKYSHWLPLPDPII